MTARRRLLAALALVLFVIGVVGMVLSVVLVPAADSSSGNSVIALAVFGVLTGVVGWILATRRPEIPLGWMMLAVGVVQALAGPADAIAHATAGTNPVVAGWVAQLGPQSGWVWVPTLGILLILIPLRFPNGRLPSPRWRWFWWTCVAVIVVCAVAALTVTPSATGIPNPAFVSWGPAAALGESVLLTILFSSLVGSFVSLFVRYRRADAVERAQLRWYLSAMGLIVALYLVGNIENGIFGDERAPGVAGEVARALDVVNNVAISAMPIAILVAVLRRGLYAIDRIISRTAAYAAVTLGVIVVYVGVVLLGSLLLPDSPSVPVAAGTLAAAAIFLPLLRVIRRRVDRRFNRSQYDAQAIVDAFGERIRTGADPHEAARDLAAAVERSLQPTSLGLWTPEGAR